MAEPSDGSGNPRLPQHPLVDQLKPDPNQPAKRVVVLVGLPGNSDRSGYQRLYLSTKLDYFAEFLSSDVVSTETVPASDSPFSGHDATRVSISRDATIHYVRVRSPQPVDEFDLDVRLAAPRAPTAAGTESGRETLCGHPNGCTNGTCHTDCDCPTNTCHNTRCGATCDDGTCPRTQCGDTCAGAATCCGTCVTCAAIATCPQTCVP
jgi:hypothetical protein